MSDRLGMPVSGRGLIAGRYGKALAVCKNDVVAAGEYAAAQTYKGFWRDTPGVVADFKAAVTAMATGDAGGLAAPNAIADFLGLMRGRTLIDRVAGFARKPLNVSVLVFGTDATSSVVAEGEAKPLSKFDLTRVTLVPKKATAQIVLTDEVLRHADPEVERSIGVQLAAAVGAEVDRFAFDPDRAGSIPHGGNVISSTGTSLAAIDSDLKLMLSYFANSDDALEGAIWVMSATTGAYLAGLRGSSGGPAFPGMNLRSGGNVWGIPVFISAAMRAVGSPGEGSILLCDPRQVLLGDEGQAAITVARNASIQMDTAPNSTASTSISLFQAYLIAIRGERWFAVQRASDAACVTLNDVAY